MGARELFFGSIFLVASAASALGCGADVVVNADAEGGRGGDVVGGAGGSGGSTSGCAGSPDFCADDCGSDYFPYEEECVDGQWQCPEGSVNPNDCPPGTCWGGPLSCETCGPSGWECEPTIECAGTCGGIVCAVCPDQPGSMMLGACECACDDVGNFSCDLAPGCCNEDVDCGDESYVACVENVCKTPVLDACWKDTECQPGEVCEGVSVCPCGYDCYGPDQPGSCVPG